MRLSALLLICYTSLVKNLSVKLLLNRIQYDPSKDLAEIFAYFFRRGVNLTFKPVHTDITGYGVTSVQNPMGNYQNVLTGAQELVEQYLANDGSDDICALIIEGYKEFGNQIPSESESRQYMLGTQTVFLSANADDSFYDTYPNFKIWLMHELMHAIGTIAATSGFPVVDAMDVLVAENGQKLFYYLNQTPEDVNSNFERTFESFYATGFLTV